MTYRLRWYVQVREAGKDWETVAGFAKVWDADKWAEQEAPSRGSIRVWDRKEKQVERAVRA